MITTRWNVILLEPPAIEQIQDIKVEEGGNVVKECKETAGTPSPTIFWKNINAGKVWYRKLLNITDIRRNQRGEYSCFANNTCGNDSTTMFIDVQCKNMYHYIFIHSLFSQGVVTFAVRCFSVCYIVCVDLLSLFALITLFLLYIVLFHLI